MPKPQNPSNRKQPLDAVLSEFDSKEDMLAALCARTKSLIEASLEDADIPYQSVQIRVKSKKKLAEKYMDPKKDYRQLDDITDLAGLRVITYYEDDVDRAAKVVEREFAVDRPNSVDKRNTEADRFGYNGLNYVCAHVSKRVADVEYKKFAGVKCEIQITSILRHAWSEMEHEWYDLKDAYPREVKRRFYRIAALLELAESEFLDIRNRRTQYERSVAVRVEANVLDIPINAVSLKSFIEQESIVRHIDASMAKATGLAVERKPDDAWIERRAASLTFMGIKNLHDLRNSLEQFKDAIPEYFARCRSEKAWPTPTLGAELPKGISVYHFTGMLASLGGPEGIKRLWTHLGSSVTWDISRQAAIAKEVAAKYSLG
jgi:GTP pyrophosphokinase